MYDAFDMKRRGSLSPRLLTNAARARRAGFHQSATRGSASQIGGVVVLGPDGEPRYAHIEDVAGDLADLDEVLAALSDA